MAPSDSSNLSPPGWLDLVRAAAWDPPNLPLFRSAPWPEAADAAAPFSGGSPAAGFSSAGSAGPRARANASLAGVDTVAPRAASVLVPSKPNASDEDEDAVGPIFSPDKPGYHNYMTINEVCAPEYQCTPEEMTDAHRRFGVPGRDPSTLLESKNRYTARDPWTGDVPAGPVRTTISNDGMTITNRTLRGHYLYDGKIVRTLLQGPDGGWYVITRGTGNNVIPGAAELNQLGGPHIFNEVDRQMRSYIMQRHRAAPSESR